MTDCRFHPRVCIALALAMMLTSGCAPLLGGGERADIYRFGVPQAGTSGEIDATPTTPGTPAGPTIAFSGASFPPAADSRILTVSGTQVSYLAKSRWVTPAVVLFNAAVRTSLEQPPSTLVIAGTKGLPAAGYVLLVDVLRFEADYNQGDHAPPEILIDARVKLVRLSDRQVLGDWIVAQTTPADANRVTAIVTAFDRGTGVVTARIAELVRRTVPA